MRQSPKSKAAGRPKVLSEVADHTYRGGLHRSLGIPLGHKIPAGMLAVKPGDSTKVKRQKNLAKTYAKYRGSGRPNGQDGVDE